MKELINYGSIHLLNIENEKPNNLENYNADYIKVCLPAMFENRQYMQQKGFVFADRILDVSINIQHTKINYEKLARIKLEKETGCKNEMLDIAKQSFPTDRRFHISPNYNNELASRVLKCCINDIPCFFVCRVKGEIAGFLALEKVNNTKASIKLAAVKEKYRIAGVALSLYSGAIQYAIDHQYTKIIGCISSTNMAVMNLYAYLGATFSNPREVFLKEVE